jgi:CRISPR-associated DxTHG motif protein
MTINFKGEMMKKAVITICGLIGGAFDKEQQKYLLKPQKADYKNGSLATIKTGEYINMLPLLIESYPEYDVIALATKDAKSVQELVTQDEYQKKFSFQDIEENKETEYSDYFKMVNKVLENYDKIVIDLSHGFRHLPLLALIALITQNLKYPDKIEHILFAQELEREKKYKIIDLIEYLDLANLSYMLSMFNQNYTISNQMTFSKDEYTELSKELKTFSEHFLANSLKPLIEGTVSKNIIKKLTTLKEDEKVNNFSDDIDKIIGHIKSIQQLKDEKNEWMKLYTLSKIMCDGGYMLNAITLLFEAIGFYCANSLSMISETTKKHITFFKTDIIDKKEPKSKYSTYALVNQSRNFVKLVSEFSGEYLYNPQTINWSEEDLKKKKPKPKDQLKAIQCEIETYLGSLDIGDFQNFIREMETLRNNLAHGNSGESLTNAKEVYDKNLKNFKKFCINDNVLQKK